MYICYECLLTFYEPKRWTESHGLTPPHEKFYGCPYCCGAYLKEDDYEKMINSENNANDTEVI